MIILDTELRKSLKLGAETESVPNTPVTQNLELLQLSEYLNKCTTVLIKDGGESATDIGRELRDTALHSFTIQRRLKQEKKEKEI